MDSQLRRSWPARIAAAGFILVILFGNFWIGYIIFQKPAPAWVEAPFVFGFVVAFFAGIAFCLLALGRKLGLIPYLDDLDDQTGNGGESSGNGEDQSR